MMERVMQHIHRMVSPHQVKPNPYNCRVYSKQHVRAVAASISTFGFAAPLLVDELGVILAGHVRAEAAKLLDLKLVPAIVIEGLSPAQKRALLLADNRIAQNSGWDRERLSIELPDLQQMLSAEDLDIAITGFEPVEIDKLQTDFEDDSADPAADDAAIKIAVRRIGPALVFERLWEETGCRAVIAELAGARGPR
jgi:ParB-like chromosome segregation protein Spo0J